MKRLALVVVAACGGGSAKPAAAPQPAASTACLPADFDAEVFRVDGSHVHVCDDDACAKVDVPDGRWSEVSAAEAEATRALDVVGNAGWSWSEGEVEVCDPTTGACERFNWDDPGDLRGMIYDSKRELDIYVRESDGDTVLAVSHGGAVTSISIDAPRALNLAFLGDAALVGEMIIDPLTLDGVYVGGGDQPWYQIGGWAHVGGALWAFGDGAALVVLQDVATGEVRHSLDLWETAGMMLGPERIGDDLVVVRGTEVVVISAAGEEIARFVAPPCT